MIDLTTLEIEQKVTLVEDHNRFKKGAEVLIYSVRNASGAWVFHAKDEHDQHIPYGFFLNDFDVIHEAPFKDNLGKVIKLKNKISVKALSIIGEPIGAQSFSICAGMGDSLDIVGLAFDKNGFHILVCRADTPNFYFLASEDMLEVVEDTPIQLNGGTDTVSLTDLKEGQKVCALADLIWFGNTLSNEKVMAIKGSILIIHEVDRTAYKLTIRVSREHERGVTFWINHNEVGLLDSKLAEQVSVAVRPQPAMPPLSGDSLGVRGHVNSSGELSIDSVNIVNDKSDFNEMKWKPEVNQAPGTLGPGEFKAQPVHVPGETFVTLEPAPNPFKTIPGLTYNEEIIDEPMTVRAIGITPADPNIKKSEFDLIVKRLIELEFEVLKLKGIIDGK